MSAERFQDIRRFLRFDDKRAREFRPQTDHMTAFRYIWDFLFQTAKNGIARINVLLLMSNWCLSRDNVDFSSIFQPNQENTA